MPENNASSDNLIGALDSPQLVLLVQHAFEIDPELRGAPIDLLARGAQLTLLGRVPSAELRERAERAALSVPGVAEVNNQLEVGD